MWTLCEQNVPLNSLIIIRHTFIFYIYLSLASRNNHLCSKNPNYRLPTVHKINGKMYVPLWKCTAPAPLFFSVWGQVAQSHILAARLDFLISNLLHVCSGWRRHKPVELWPYCILLCFTYCRRTASVWSARFPWEQCFLSRWTSFIDCWLSYQLKLADWSHEEAMLIDIWEVLMCE